MSGFIQLQGSLYSGGKNIVKAAISKDSNWSIDSYVSQWGDGSIETEFMVIVSYCGLIMRRFSGFNHASAFADAWEWANKLYTAEKCADVHRLKAELGPIKYDLFIEAKGTKQSGKQDN